MLPVHLRYHRGLRFHGVLVYLRTSAGRRHLGSSTRVLFLPKEPGPTAWSTDAARNCPARVRCSPARLRSPAASAALWSTPAAIRRASASTLRRPAAAIRTSGTPASLQPATGTHEPASGWLQVPLLPGRRRTRGHELPGLRQGLWQMVQPVQQPNCGRLRLLLQLRQQRVLKNAKRAPALAGAFPLFFIEFS